VKTQSVHRKGAKVAKARKGKSLFLMFSLRPSRLRAFAVNALGFHSPE
jgi:hypothetical protein